MRLRSYSEPQMIGRFCQVRKVWYSGDQRTAKSPCAFSTPFLLKGCRKSYRPPNSLSEFGRPQSAKAASRRLSVSGVSAPRTATCEGLAEPVRCRRCKRRFDITLAEAPGWQPCAEARHFVSSVRLVLRATLQQPGSVPRVLAPPI